MKFTYKITDVTTVKIKKKNIISAGIISQPLKGPLSEPLFFKSITEGMEYIRKFNKNGGVSQRPSKA